MKAALIVLLCQIAACSVWAQGFYVVNLQGDAGLHRLYDAGLEPHQVPGLENCLCEVRAQMLGFRLDTVELPALRANWDFIVTRERRLVTVRGYTPALSRNEAFRSSVRLERLLEGSVETLRHWMESAQQIPQEPYRRAHQFGNHVHVAYQLIPTAEEWKPFLLHLSITRDLPSEALTLGDAPLMPTRGYEHFGNHPSSGAHRTSKRILPIAMIIVGILLLSTVLRRWLNAT